MSSSKSDLRQLQASSWADFNYKYRAGFIPKEYRRSFKDYFDKRFVLIWLATFIVHFSTALYYSINPPSTLIKPEDIDRIQKQFATLVLEKESEQIPVEPGSFSVKKIVSEKFPASDKVQGKSVTGTGGGLHSEDEGDVSATSSIESRNAGGAPGNEKRRSYGEQISQEVSSKGLLGLLTGSGSNAKGEAVTDVLGEAADSQGDLDKALGDLDGLKKPDKSGTKSISNQGRGRHTQKGIRSTEGGGINDLIGGKEQVRSADMHRKGNIVVEQVSEIANERGIKSESRDPDKVSEVINRHNSSIQYCYQRELKQNSDLKGKLVVRFTVTPAGNVKDVKVISSTLSNPGIERCVVSRIKRWDDFGEIDPSRGDATFKQVYTFGY